MPGEKASILVVDNDWSVLENLELVLSAAGYEVATATSGAEALVLMTQREFDLVLADACMSEMDGVELVERVKEQWAETEVVVLTTNAEQDKALTAVRQGAYDYLNKATSAEDVLFTLERTLDKKRREAELRRRNQDLAALNTVAATVSRCLDLEEVLSQGLAQSMEITEAQAAGIYLLEPDGETMTLRLYRGVSEDTAQAASRIKLGEGVAGQAAARREPLAVEVATGYPTPWLQPTMEAEALQHMAAAPLLAKEALLGVLSVARRAPRAFSQDDLHLLTAIGQQIAIAIENARLYERSTKQAEDLALLNEVGQLFASTLEEEAIFQQLTRRCVEVFHVDSCLLRVVEGDRLVIVGSHFRDPEDEQEVLRLLEETPLRVGDGIAGRVVETGKAAMSGEALVERLTLSPFVDYLRDRHWLVVPMKANGQVIGVLTLMTSEPTRPFTERDRSLAEGVAHQAAVAIENARLFSETREARDAVLSVLEDLNEAMTREQVRVQELERLTEQLATANEESDRLAAQLAAINRLDHVISSSLELEEIYRAFAEESRKIIPFDCMSVALVEEDQVRMLALGTEMETALGAELVFPLAGSAIEAVMESGQPLIRCDLVAEERYPLDRQLIAAGLRSSVLVPLVAKGRVLGSFNVDSCQVGAYGQEDLAILQSLADQLAIAIENARLYEMERQAREEAEALRDATATLVGSLELNQMLERILNGVHRVIPHDAANIALIEGDMVHFVRWRGYERFGMNTQMPGLGFHIADTPNFRHMVETGQPVVIPDTAVAPEWIQVPGWEWIRSYVGTPIQVREKLIGFLNLDSATPGFFNADHARLLAAFAQQIGLALENARLFEETQRRLRELSALFEVSRALRGAESVEEMLPIILEKTMEVLEADTGALFRVDERTEEFVAQVAQGRLESLLGLRLGPTEGMCGYVAQTRAPYPFTNLARDPHTGARVQALVEGVQGGICVPLLVGETLVGTLVIGNDEPRTFSDDELRLLTAIADMAASAIHRASLFEELQQVNAKLSRTLKLQEEMIQNVSHELRTPLALIRGYAELMEQGGLGMLQPEQADAVRVIVERSQQLGRMIDLLIAIQDADWQPPRLEQVDLVMLVQEVTTAWRARTETKGFHLQLLSDVETLLVPADRKKLRQALDNLLDNAFKFSHPGSQVTVRVWYEEGTARLAVSDQGIGLTPEQLEQVFERFYQADGGMTRRYGGLGLGLALCKEIVAAHGGRIWVESAGKGKGSTFHVTLPAAWEHEAPVPRKHSALVTH